MKIRVLIISLLCCFSFLAQAATGVEATSKPKTLIRHTLLSSLTEEEEEGMIKTFSEAYSQFAPEELFGAERVTELGGTEVALKNALREAFKEERETLGILGVSHLRLETGINMKRNPMISRNILCT